MPAPQAPLRGDALLDAVTDAMVALHERYYHRRPGNAKTQLMGGDLLVCVMGEVYTDVEKTLIEIQRSVAVQESRTAFQQAMRQRFIDAVECLSGRHVMAFVSSNSVGPDMEIELFILTPQSLADTETGAG